MAELDKQGTVSLEELMVSTLAMTDALAAPDRKRLDLERRVQEQANGRKIDISGDIETVALGALGDRSVR